MSTILKALNELEKRGAPVTQPEPAWDDRSMHWRWGAGALACLLGVSGLAVFFLGRTPPHPQAAVAPAPVAPAPVARTPVAAAPVVPAPVAPASVARPNVARVQPASEVPAARAAAHAAPPPPAVPRRNEAPQARVDKGRIAAAPAAPPVPPAKPKAREAQAAIAPAASAPGEGGIEVKSITYSADPAQRVVAIRVGGGRVVKLHEGESAGAIEVQLISRGTVYLRHGGNVFAVGAPE